MMIRTSIVGFGYFGRIYFDRLSQHPQFEVVNVVDTSKKQRALVPLPVKVHDNLGDALGDRIDLVVICTPADAASEIAIESLSRSIDVLLCKPGAESLGQAQRIARTARENRSIVMVDYTPRNTSAWKHLRMELPRIRMHVQTTRFNTTEPRHDVGVILDLAAHDVALICDLTTRSLSVTSAWQTKNGDAAGVRITDNHSLTASVSVSHSSSKQSRIFKVADGWSLTEWDQISGMVTSGANGYWETIATHDVRDPVSIQLDRTAKAMRHRIDDDSDTFLRVMDVLSQALSRIEEKSK